MRLAQARGGVVVNADSMQVYDMLSILTARPQPGEMGGVEHRLYGHVPAGEAYSSGEWMRQAQAVMAELRAKGRLPVFVGGTGLYFKALTGGLSDMPAVPADIRDGLRVRLAQEGAEALHGDLVRRDPQAAAAIRPADGQRILRALEILDVSGRSIRDFQSAAGPALIDPARALKLVVLPERSLLHQRIDGRFAGMLKSGAIEEVRALLALGLPPQMPVMKAIGVPQISALLAGQMGEDEVIERGAAATRQYAKRQMTWFRNQMDDSWIRTDGVSGVPG